MGLPALLLALAGIVCMLRRRLASDWVILAAIAGYVAILPPLRWVLLRYELPLIVLFGLCAGVALERLSSRWRPWLTAAALIMPLAGSIAQINYMRSPHPANLMLQRVLETVPRGSAISRLFLEAPPLDRKVYPMSTDLFTGDLSRHPPCWVLTSDLPDEPFPASNVAYLRSNYEEVA